MLTGGFEDGDSGIGIRCSSDDSKFNLRRLQNRNKVLSNITAIANGCDVSAAEIKLDMRNSFNKFYEACNNFFLEVSTTTANALVSSGKALCCYATISGD